MTNSTSWEPATGAVKEGDVPALERVVLETPQILEERNPEGHTLLGLACKAATGDLALPPVAGRPEHHAVVDMLLAAGADPSAAANDGWAPLHSAAMTCHIDLARRLLAAGANREGRLHGARGGSPLALALFYAQTEMAKFLANPPVPDNLRTAAALNLPIDRFLTDDGLGLSPQASEGTDFYRPLLVFPLWQRTNSRQELLDEALSWAARHDALDAMEALVRLGGDVNSNPYRGTPLVWAVYSDRVAAAAWLLDHGADPDLRHDFGGEAHGAAAVAMHLAAQFGSLKCLRLLLDRGADATIKDAKYHATPLGWAEYGGSAAAAAMLRSHA